MLRLVVKYAESKRVVPEDNPFLFYVNLRAINLAHLYLFQLI